MPKLRFGGRSVDVPEAMRNAVEQILGLIESGDVPEIPVQKNLENFTTIAGVRVGYKADIDDHKRLSFEIGDAQKTDQHFVKADIIEIGSNGVAAFEFFEQFVSDVNALLIANGLRDEEDIEEVEEDD